MADKKPVPKGPGQAEVNGDINNPRDSYPVGTYQDPETKVQLEVSMAAGADALARMGWKFVKPLGQTAPPAVPAPEEEEPAEEAAPAPSPAPETEAPAPAEPKTDTGDKVEAEAAPAPEETPAKEDTAKK